MSRGVPKLRGHGYFLELVGRQPSRGWAWLLGALVAALAIAEVMGAVR